MGERERMQYKNGKTYILAADLFSPEPDRPVNHTVAPTWPRRRLLSSRVTSPSCQVTLLPLVVAVVGAILRASVSGWPKVDMYSGLKKN